MRMIILITYQERWHYDRYGNKTASRFPPITMVSHGIDKDTRQGVVLQNERLDYYIALGAKRNEENEWEI